MLLDVVFWVCSANGMALTSQCQSRTANTKVELEIPAIKLREISTKKKVETNIILTKSVIPLILLNLI